LYKNDALLENKGNGYFNVLNIYAVFYNNFTSNLLYKEATVEEQIYTKQILMIILLVMFSQERKGKAPFR
jgi:hypothetical protein